MKSRTIVLTGIVISGLSVVVGAFGAHGLREMLEHTGRADTFELAVRYQFYHALAILAVGILADRTPRKEMAYAAWLFLAGIVFFSGSLYVLSVTGVTILGAVTPIGGLLMIAGWLLLFIGVYKK